MPANTISPLTDKVAFRLPTGFNDRITRAARRAQHSRAEWLRGLVRRGLESSERAARRRRASYVPERD